MQALAVDLDGVLCDTRPLWRAWLEAARPVLGFDTAELSEDRAEAASDLDRRGAGNWRTLLERWAEERAPVYVRRDAETGAALRTLEARGSTVGVFTDAPEPLARIALAQLGADRRISALATGASALDRLLETLGNGAVVVETRAQLLDLAP